MTTHLQYAEFRTACVGCRAGLLVVHRDRESGVRCSYCGAVNGPWPIVPHVDSIPDVDADLKSMIRFSDSYNPIPFLRETLGDGYDVYIDGLREESKQAFRAGQRASGNLEALLACFAYEVAAMPFVGISEENAARLFRWFIDGIRRAVNDAA